MGPTGESSRILQVHPTLRCNLRCRHCYSSSDPRGQEGIPQAVLLTAVDEAALEGYNALSVSGGEPLLHPGLTELLDRARVSGMATLVVSNGMLLDERRLAWLAGRTDLLAISIDGVPASHNRIRGSERAFGLMLSHLEGVRRAGLLFGFIFTLTQQNAGELEWVADFAIEQGAGFLHVHPLEEVGRAEQEMRGLEPDGVEAAVGWLEALRLQARYRDRLRVQVDLLDCRCLVSQPERVLAGEVRSDWESAPLGELLSPLVVEADGTLVPLQYGFARKYALGRLGTGSLHQLAAAWKAEGYIALTELCRRTLEALTTSAELPIVNWYRVIARAATGESAVPAAL